MKYISECTKLIVLTGLLVSLLNSCNIEKRMHLRGYHITYNKIYKDKNSVKKSDLADNSLNNNEVEKKVSENSDFVEILPNPIGFTKETSFIDTFIQSKPLVCSDDDLKNRKNEGADAIVSDERPLKYSSLKNLTTQVQNFRNKGVFLDKTTKAKEETKKERKDAIIKGGAIILLALLAGISLPVLGTLTASIGLVAMFLLDILISYGINKYYKKRKPRLAKVSSFLRLAYSAVFGIGIGYHIFGNVAKFTMFWQTGLIIFGLHLITLGILFNNEGGKRWVNIAIKTLLITAGIGYLVWYIGVLIVANPIAFAALMELIFIIPMITGELSFAVWMIFKGGKKSKQ